ncbi:MAG: hypothetical protein K9W46_00440 [Candidatus Heimdallarchaeum endolithica]|uniref:Uncharacterized protein n=1 Tax=Candidatus Heimdallarchaeum endolithica TaxID=2876572 RepID=A0A9Y1BR26_9ARCH|nr:MAG: hypothetical protein K9W46_00440 [Candidatus Heimdallarchaeum endolithica]
MFDPSKVKKIKENLENLVFSSLHDLKSKEIEDIYEKLFFLNYNERSVDLFKLYKEFHTFIKKNNTCQKKPYILKYFLLLNHLYSQAMFFEPSLLKSLSEEIEQISSKYGNIPEIQALKTRIDAVLFKMEKKFELSTKKIKEAFQIAKKFKEQNREIFYDIAFSYLSFYPELMKKLSKSNLSFWNEVINYFYNTEKIRSYLVIKSIFILFLIRQAQNEKAKELMQEIENENILEKVHSEIKIMITFRLGKSYYLLKQYSLAEKHFKLSFDFQKQANLIYPYYFFALESLKFLARSSVFKGNIEKSMEYLKELYQILAKLENKIDKKTHDYYLYKLYLTLRFIYYVMDKDFSEEVFPNLKEQLSKLVKKEEFLFLKDQNLLIEYFIEKKDGTQHDYIELVANLLFVDDIPKEEIEKRLSELHAELKERTFTQEYSIINKLESCKILLSRGLFGYFHSLIEELTNEIQNTEVIIYKIQFKIYKLIDLYLQDKVKNKKRVLKGLSELENESKKLKFIKLNEEIKMYKLLINSECLAEKLKEDFMKIALQEEYEEQSKQVIQEFMNNKN